VLRREWKLPLYVLFFLKLVLIEDDEDEEGGEDE